MRDREQESPLQTARRIAPQAATSAGQTEQERALPPELVRELRDGGLFSLCLPRALGGGEVEPAELVLALEALAQGDGASAWCAMVASTCGLLGAYLPRDQAELIFDGGRSILAGVFAPRGRARHVEEGYVLSGRWSFVSGVSHSDWVLGGCLVEQGDGIETVPGGAPDVRLMLMPREEVEVIDTWSVAGLCGTGSHDIAVEGRLIPAGRGVSLFSDRPRIEGALYAFPLFGLLALGICAVALGIARGAIEDFIELAAGKRVAPGVRSLAERGTIQAEVARAEARLRAARALVLEEARAAWEPASLGAQLSEEHKLSLRLAATHATQTAAAVTGAMYRAGGASAIYDSSPLQRRFRDVNVATQHMMVAPATWEIEGRILLGLPTDTSQL